MMLEARLNQAQAQTKHKIGLLSREPLLYFKFNKPSEQNVSEINLFQNSTFPSLKITVDALIDVRNETSKRHFLKSDNINT